MFTQLNQSKADAKKYQWLITNSNKWSWIPNQYNKDIVSGFAAGDTGYLEYDFHAAVKLAMRGKK